MKRKKKVLLVVLAMMVTVCAMTGCGGKKVDYSTWTYSQFQNADIDWDSDVAYQFVLREDGNSSSYAGVYPAIMNLLESGAVVMFEPSYCVGEPTNQFEAIEGYEDEKMLEIFYGYWTEDDNNITINMKYSEDAEMQSYTVEKNDSLMTVSVTMAYPGGDVPVGSEMDCNGTIQYSSWKDYCAYATSAEFFNRLIGAAQ